MQRGSYTDSLLESNVVRAHAHHSHVFSAPCTALHCTRRLDRRLTASMRQTHNFNCLKKELLLQDRSVSSHYACHSTHYDSPARPLLLNDIIYSYDACAPYARDRCGHVEASTLHELVNRFCLVLSPTDFQLICSVQKLDRYNRIDYVAFLETHDPLRGIAALNKAIVADSTSTSTSTSTSSSTDISTSVCCVEQRANWPKEAIVSSTSASSRKPKGRAPAKHMPIATFCGYSSGKHCKERGAVGSF